MAEAETPTKAVVRRAAGRAFVPAEADQPQNFLQVIQRAAADPRTDVAKMQALLAMVERQEDRAAEKAFNADFIALQHDLPVIRPDGKIEIKKDGRLIQTTPYASFQNIMKVIKPKLEKHNFCISFATEPSATPGQLLVVGVLAHRVGHQRSTKFPLPMEQSGSKNPVQGWGSTLSYGKRYATIALLNIISHAKEDSDTDGNEGDFRRAKGGTLVEAVPQKTLTREQATALSRLADECHVPPARIFEMYGIERLDDLEQALLPKVEAACRDYKAKWEAKNSGR